MTQVSLYGDIPNEIQLEAHSDESDDDDENQNEKIRQRLMEHLPEESFEFDDCDNSSENDSRSSSVNHNNSSGFLFNQDISRQSRVALNKSGTPLNGSYTSNNNSFSNGVNLNMLPNSIMDASDNLVLYPLNMNGNGSSPDFGAPLHGHAKLNGNLVNGNGPSHISPSTTKPKKQVTIVESFQKNRGQDEIEESNPTISLLHQQHCPRTENGHVNSEMLSAADNKEEQMQSLLDTRARQLERSEEEVLKLQKDKRSLSHQVGLMKTELNHMKSQHEEALKIIKLREQDCEYLRGKLHEAIEDYEQARAQGIAARDKAAELESEIGRLKDEIKLLSSIGSSAHQTEVNDIVRQLREKHANEIVSWKKVVDDLEGQLRTYKRQPQQQAVEQVFKAMPMNSNASCQTDEIHVGSPSTFHSEEPHRRRERTKFSLLKDDDGDVLIKEKTIVSLQEKLEEIELRFEEEKNKIKETYQKEIDVYRHKLAVLPGELYKQWEAKQAELGIQAYFDSKPICVDAFTSIDQEEFQLVAANFQPTTETGGVEGLLDTEAQVNFGSLMMNRESVNSQGQQANSMSHTSSVSVQTYEKETSSVTIQTDETLETFKILGSLLSTWANEVQTAKANEEECMLKCRKYEEELHQLEKNFKILQKIATKCRKESKLKEENFNKEIATLKSHYMEVLKKLEQKLDVLA